MLLQRTCSLTSIRCLFGLAARRWSSDAELVALAVCQAAIGICSDRQFLGLVGCRAAGLVSASARSVAVQPAVAGAGRADLDRAATARALARRRRRASERRDADRCRELPGLSQRSEFAGFARYGYAKSQHRFVWGVRLVLLTDERGLPLGYTLVPANEKEYEPLADLLTGTPAEVVIGDKGFWGRAYQSATRRRRHDAAHTRQGTHRRQHRPRACARLNPARDRERLLEPERPDAARTAPRQAHQPGSPSGSRNGSSRSPSASCSTPSAAAPHAPSPPTTAAKSHQASSRPVAPPLPQDPVPVWLTERA